MDRLFNLSNAQQRTIITEISNPDNKAYILSFKSRFPIEDLKNVEKALSILISGNLLLRIRKDKDMNFKQYISQEKGEFSFKDMEDVDNAEIENFILEFSNKPFDQIFEAPLYQFILLKKSNEILVLGKVHHIIMDGTSVTIFARELERCVNKLRIGEEYKLETVSYEEYVQKEIEYLSSDQSKEDEEFWLFNLDGYSKNWYYSDNFHIKREFLPIKQDLRDKLKKLYLVDGESISPFILALSAVSLYFAKISGIDDFVWNSVYHGRDFRGDIPDMLGMFVNMMPLRLVYDKNRIFKDILLYTKSVVKNGLNHGMLSFNQYGPKLQRKGIDPSMLSMYSMVSNSTDENVEFLFNNTESEFPFHIRVNPSLSDKDGLQLLVIEYNDDCFSPDQIKIILEDLIQLLTEVSDNPYITGAELDFETIDYYDAERFFQKMLSESEGPTSITSDINEKEEEKKWKEKTISIDGTKMREFCTENNARPDYLFLSATILALVKFVFNKNILISIILPEINQELPFKVDLDTSITGSDYLDLIEKLAQEVTGYHYYPFTRISCENFILPEFIYTYGSNRYGGNHKLSLNIIEEDNYFKICMGYSPALYSDSLMDTFTESIALLVNSLMNKPSTHLKNISISNQDNQEAEFSIELVDEPLLNRLFEKQVKKSRDQTALIAADGEFTFEQMNKMANRIAHALIKQGVKVEDRIIFMLKRDSKLIAAMLGIVKAGATFIPVDPDYPPERIKLFIEDSAARYIITKEDLPNSLDVDELLKEENETNPDPILTLDNLCYIIYTSGSTGRPKGVMLTHGGITNYISPDPRNIPIHALLNRSRRMISISTVSFIVFLRETLATLSNGMPVIFASEEESINPLKLVKLFERTGADAFGATPTRLLQYLELEEVQKIMPRCRVIIVGGETFPAKLYKILSKYTLAEIYNSYGPTEITIASHGKLLTSDDISAGEPLLNVTDRIMDIDGNPLPNTVTGELYVAGAGVARGYWNNQELTEEKFITYHGLRYYNTGDLARRNANGELYVLGRMDTQIKLRGLRIELGEIENQISKYDDIKSVSVILKQVHGDEHICAYFTADQEVDIPYLKNKLLEALPRYMVPSYFIQMETFPMTFNGKTDLMKLPEPSLEDFRSDEVIKPETDLEREIYDICANILNNYNFGVVTDLFQLGLTSLSVLKLVSEISKKLGVIVNVTNIMKARNVREIAREVSTSDVLKKTYQKQQFYPITQNQWGVYFDCVKYPEKLNYNLPKMIRFKHIDSQKLKNALEDVIEKHPYLKMHLVMREGEIYQKRQDNLKLSIDEQEGKVNDAIIKDFIRPFSLFEGPLFRFKIFTHPDETVLLCDFHHILVDGTSLNILFHDLGTIYDGGVVDEEINNGFNLSLDELDLEKSELYNEAREYFGSRISKFDNATVISPDLKGKEEMGKLGVIGVTIPKDKVENFCKKNSITPNNLFLAATVFTLSKFVYNKDILISTITNGRNNPQFQNTIAMMVKTLPVALNIKSTYKVKDFFNYLENIWFDVLKYQVYPFTRISDEYEIYPEFLYAFHGKIIDEIHINGQKLERENLEYEALKFKTSVNVIDTGSRFHLLSQYNDALYSNELMETFIKSLELVVYKMIKDPKALLKDISITTEDAGTGEFLVKTVTEQLVNKLFEIQVDENKYKVSLIAADGEFTYDELNRKANRIAHSLIKRGVEAEDRIMIILKRDSNLIATVLGIMKAGCAFIPVDPEYPEDRVKHVLNDSSARYVITTLEMSNALHLDQLLLEENEENPETVLSPENLCYLIYTSGSTGLPKGVMLTHKNISNYLSPDPENCYAHAFVNKAHKMLSISTVAFDVFLHEAFITLMNGRTLVFADDEASKNPQDIIELFKNAGADAFSATPSRMMQYLEVEGFCDVLSNCKIISVAGEKYPPQLHKKLVECTDGEIYNVYGPTETTISCNTKHVTDGDNITVGEPLLNVVENVMDLDGNPLPDGVIGELYVGGVGVARGYLNREELNQRQFINIKGVPYYRTGDFASREKNGEYKIYGRLDNQIKLRGLRIEIGEIESAISDYDGIKSVVVVVKKVQFQDHLCAYFTSTLEIDIDDLKGNLMKRLTKYMVPTIFMSLDKLPQTPNGKTDIKNLPEPVLKERIYVHPENNVEKFFTHTFADILGMSRVGVTDNFFDLGGTSLLVTKITIEALNQGYDIKYGDVFAHPTPRELAQVISDAESYEKDADEYSYEPLQDVLDRNIIDNLVEGENQNLGNILLTGATGFLGIHVLREFIENEKGIVYCMLRKGRRTSPEDRLKTLLFYYFSENYEEMFGSRIRVVEGDVTSRADFEKCRGYEIDTVINCAANVKHFASGSQIEDINIGGVVNCIDYCRKKDSKLIQVSTTSVAGESVDNIPPLDSEFDEKTIYIGQSLDNKYLSSKFKAERLVLEAVVNGLGGKIVRMGNLMARHSDSEFQINFETNAFINRLRAYAAIGKIPYSVMGGSVELTPIDLAARAILILGTTPNECSVFHVYNNHQIYIADIIGVMNDLGLDIGGSEEDEFSQAFESSREDESKQNAISGLVTAMGMGKGKGRGLVKVVNHYSTQILYRSGFKWPLISDEYLYMFISYLIDMDFFD